MTETTETGRPPRVMLRALAMLLPLLGAEETRYYLGGFSIEPHPAGGALIVATEGHAMGVFYDVNAIVDRAVLWQPSRALRGACGSYRQEIDDGGNGERRGMWIDNNMVDLTSPTWGTDLLADGKTKFVDWRRALPTAFAEAAYCFNTEIMARFARVGEFTGAPLVVRNFNAPGIPGGHSPLAIAAADEPHFFGALMPLLPSTKLTALPDWLQLPPAKEVSNG